MNAHTHSGCDIDFIGNGCVRNVQRLIPNAFLCISLGLSFGCSAVGLLDAIKIVIVDAFRAIGVVFCSALLCSPLSNAHTSSCIRAKIFWRSNAFGCLRRFSYAVCFPISFGAFCVALPRSFYPCRAAPIFGSIGGLFSPMHVQHLCRVFVALSISALVACSLSRWRAHAHGA